MKKDDKILLKYSSKEDLLTNNQIVKVYFDMPSASLADLAEKILLQKYNRRNQEMTVKKAINKIRGVRFAEVNIFLACPPFTSSVAFLQKHLPSQIRQ